MESKEVLSYKFNDTENAKAADKEIRGTYPTAEVDWNVGKNKLAITCLASETDGVMEICERHGGKTKFFFGVLG